MMAVAANENNREPVREASDCKISYALVKDNHGALVKNILYEDTTSGNNHKDKFFHGFFQQDVPVVIVKLNTNKVQNQKEIQRECFILKKLERHENFIRFYGYEECNDFLYMAMEKCMGSFADLLEPNRTQMTDKKEILKSFKAKEMLRQSTNALLYLHQHDFVHRNVKPNNFWIKKIGTTNQYVVKITDFRLTRQWDKSKSENLSGSAASEGWEAPESRVKEAELKKSLDVFILGCLFNYVLTTQDASPKHPFGDKEEERVYNIHTGKQVKENLFKPITKEDQQVCKLMQLMMQKDEAKRITLEEVLQHSYFQPSENYDIYGYEIPGLCIIFNQLNFKDTDYNRPGSEKDCERLENTFWKLGFEVETFQDLPSYNLEFEVNQLAKRDYTNYGSLVVCLLSHGIENAVMCWDGKLVNVNELKYEFTLEVCPTLYGKPKIFIVQACQGGLKQNETGIVYPSENSSPGILSRLYDIYNSWLFGANAKSSVRQTQKKMNMDKDMQGNAFELQNSDYPPIMDFLTIKSTIPGFVSYRNTKNGSKFIQELCNELENEYIYNNNDEKRDIQTMLMGLQRYIKLQTIMSEVFVSKFIVFRETTRKEGPKEGDIKRTIRPTKS